MFGIIPVILQTIGLISGAALLILYVIDYDKKDGEQK